MTFFASLVLVFVLVIRPQEIWPELAALHLLEVFTGLVVLGLVVELALRKQKTLYSPQLPFLGAFLATGYLASSLAVGTGRGITLANNAGTIPAVFMLAVMYGSRTMPRLRVTIGLLLTLGALVSAVAVHQGNVPASCIEKTLDEAGDKTVDIENADGRICGLPSDCRDDSRPGAEWACERLGMFKTFSTGRRVRWRGQLDDPNELSVFIGAVLPLLFVIGRRPASGAKESRALPPALVWTFIVVTVGLGLYAVILSQSRGGQLVVATVFTSYFVSRFGKKGLALAALMALPVLLLGGRSDAEADESAMERLELLYEGVSLVIAHPLRGVGMGQFADQVASPLHLTAHNSYLLAAAELGIPGLFFWSGVLWTSLKIPLTAWRTPRLSAEVRSTAMALVVSFLGIVVGIFFLSFTYKQLLFVWFGLAGAFYFIVREADPTLEVKVGWKDALGILGADLAILGLLFAYTRTRGIG